MQGWLAGVQDELLGPFNSFYFHSILMPYTFMGIITKENGQHLSRS